MKVTYTREYTATFDLEEAIDTFNFYVNYLNRTDYDNLIYNIVENHLHSDTYDDLGTPQHVIKKCADMLRLRIGGVQMKMDCLKEE